jgi:hypothetical protein
MGAELDTLSGHRIELGGDELFGAAPAVLVKHPEIAVTEIIAKDEEHVRLLGTGDGRKGKEREEEAVEQHGNQQVAW